MFPSEPKRILLVRLSANGDIVQSVDTLKRLRQRFPNAFIGWAVGEAGASLLKPVLPWLNAVHALPNKAWSQSWVWELFHLNTLRRGEAKVHRLLKEIRAQQYEVAIDVQGLNKSSAHATRHPRISIASRAVGKQPSTVVRSTACFAPLRLERSLAENPLVSRARRSPRPSQAFNGLCPLYHVAF